MNLLERSRKVIPGGVHSPVRSFKHVGGDPLFFERGEGAFLVDINGKRYIDFCQSFGPHILGHAPGVVVEAIKEQAAKGTSFGACHSKEVELSEILLKAYPLMDQVRLVNSGTEAVMTAVRLARGATGKPKIIQFAGCYHGHSDGLLAEAGSGVASLSHSSSKGVPESIVSETLVARWGDFEGLEAIFNQYKGQIALVVLEPVPANNGLHIPSLNDLKRVVEMAHTHSALVLFDEVITGFRLGWGGATQYYGLKPDLVTLGKIIGGGLPLAAVVGKRELMEQLAPLGDVYQAGTLSGNPLATAAGCAVLNVLEKAPPYPELEFLTTTFCQALEERLQKWAPLSVRRIASIFWIDFTNDKNFPPTIEGTPKEKYKDIFHRGLESGIYFAPSPYEVGFLSSCHTTEVLNIVLDKVSRWK